MPHPHGPHGHSHDGPHGHLHHGLHGPSGVPPRGLHGPAGHPHRGPHRHQWFYNLESEAPIATFASVLRTFAESLTASGKVKLGETEVALPDDVLVVVRYERSPHGSLVLKTSAEWPDDGVRPSTRASVTDLVR